MKKQHIHILLLLLSLICLQGCLDESGPSWSGGDDMVLTIRCDETPLTKVDPETRIGNDEFNENLIQSVDFLFYPGKNPATNENAVYHIRKVLDRRVQRQETFSISIKKNVVNYIFTPETEGKQATIYALVNFNESFLDKNLQHTSLYELAQRIIETRFDSTETNFIQPSFKMDGKAVLTYHEDADPGPHVQGTINVKRFAAKLTLAVHVEDTVVLEHRQKFDEHGHDITDSSEVWTPVLHTMRVYLIDGVKKVRLGHVVDEGGAVTVILPDSLAMEDTPLSTDYFDYRDQSRYYVKNDNVTPIVSMSTEAGFEDYYETYPMYSYPRVWDNNQMPYSVEDNYAEGLPPEAPYFKLELDWRREELHGYSYDLRKYYYKVFLPLPEDGTRFIRNNWYSFFLNVGILGSETDEGKAILEPSYYILDWQNKSQVLNKYASLSAARYLSVEKIWELHNVPTLSIPFMSSHNVQILDSTVKATRPYYGEINKEGHNLNQYDTTVHAWIRKDGNSYYLEYQNQHPTLGDLAYEPSKWITCTSSSIEFNHPLQNDFEDYIPDPGFFDYSPYTIEFKIVHDDLNNPNTVTFKQYVKTIRITQYPAIYLEATRNSDIWIKDAGKGYQTGHGTKPWLDQPWGYVYINGRDKSYEYDYYHPENEPNAEKFLKYGNATRFVRWDSEAKNKSKDPVFAILVERSPNKNRKEYQWQSNWYTGGSRDLFNINVTVLPEKSEFVIGDPRTDEIDNLDGQEFIDAGLYEFIPDGGEEERMVVGARTGFAVARALYQVDPDDEERRPLKAYYPTDGSSRTKKMLAPSFRFASKFGGTEYGGTSFIGDLELPFAKYRCAAYQEDGFPAGRWRLPTKAEINFVAQLSAKKAFERLFSFGSSYWCASGAVKVNNDGTVSDISSATTALLRCVYDSWYWDSLDDRLEEGHRDEFVWGDKRR